MHDTTALSTQRKIPHRRNAIPIILSSGAPPFRKNNQPKSATVPLSQHGSYCRQKSDHRLVSLRWRYLVMSVSCDFYSAGFEDGDSTCARIAYHYRWSVGNFTCITLLLPSSAVEASVVYGDMVVWWDRPTNINSVPNACLLIVFRSPMCLVSLLVLPCCLLGRTSRRGYSALTRGSSVRCVTHHVGWKQTSIADLLAGFL